MKPSPALVLPIAFFGALWAGFKLNPGSEDGPEQVSASTSPAPHAEWESHGDQPEWGDIPNATELKMTASRNDGDADQAEGPWVSPEEAKAIRAKKDRYHADQQKFKWRTAGLSIEDMVDLLPEQYRGSARNYRGGLIKDTNSARSYVCWSPGTPLSVVETFRRIEQEAGLAPGGDVELFARQFFANARWANTAIDGVGNRNQGRPTTLTWSIAPDGTSAPNLGIGGVENLAPSDFRDWMASVYGGNANVDPQTQPYFQFLLAAFDELSLLTGITFVYEPADDGVELRQLTNPGIVGTRGDIRLAGRELDGDSGVLAFSSEPDDGDVVFDTADNFFDNRSNNSRRFVNVATHELGHSIGLAHVCPITETVLMEPFASDAFRGAQFDDLYATNRQYGDRFEDHSGAGDNDSAANATPITVPSDTLTTIEWLSIDGIADEDFFSFDVEPGRLISITVRSKVPDVGQTYLEGPQDAACDTGTLFNPTIQQNIELEFLDTDGVTVIGSSTTSALGQPEFIDQAIVRAPGTYFIRVSGDNQDASLVYDMDIISEPFPHPVQLRVTGTSIISESNHPADTFIDPGETIQVAVDVTNLGIEAGTNISATLSGPSGFTGFATQGAATNIAIDETVTWFFTLANDTICGTVVLLDLHLTGDDDVDDIRTVRIPIGEFIAGFPIDENFDGSPIIPSGWTSYAEGASQPWKISTAYSSSSPRSALGDSAVAPGQAVLESPAFVIGDQGALVEFRHRYDLETFRYDPNLEDQDEELIVDAADGGVLEVSLDGDEWVDLLEYPGVVVLAGGYTHTVVEEFFSPIAGRRAWSGDSGGFITTSLQLPPDLAFHVARFRWVSASDYSYDEDGWYVDDITVDSLVSQCKPFYPGLSLSSNGNSLSEGGGSLTGTLSTILPLIQPMSVTLETSGTADSSDLTANLDLTLPAGDTSVDFTLTATEDQIIEPEETIELSLPNADPGYAAVAPLSILLTIEKDLLTFSLWQVQNPGVDPALDADDDGDGWSTLLEYAMGTDPLDAGSKPNIDHVLTSSKLELNFPQTDEKGDLTIMGETSTDLQNWTETGVSKTATGYSVDRNGPTRFIRLNLNLTTP